MTTNSSPWLKSHHFNCGVSANVARRRYQPCGSSIFIKVWSVECLHSLKYSAKSGDTFISRLRMLPSPKSPYPFARYSFKLKSACLVIGKWLLTAPRTRCMASMPQRSHAKLKARQPRPTAIFSGRAYYRKHHKFVCRCHGNRCCALYGRTESDRDPDADGPILACPISCCVKSRGCYTPCDPQPPLRVIDPLIKLRRCSSTSI